MTDGNPNTDTEIDGNKNHEALQELISKKSFFKKDNANNYICKMFAHGTLDIELNGNPSLTYKNTLIGYNERLIHQLPFALTEKLKGEELWKLLHNKILYEKIFLPKHKIHILIQVAKALQFIHNQGYIYYDLKPENIVLTKPFNSTVKKPEIRLIYFGMLIHKDKAKENRPRAGTKAFMAPEVWYKDRYKYGHTNKLDVFSFGKLMATLNGFPDHVFSDNNDKLTESEFEQDVNTSMKDYSIFMDHTLLPNLRNKCLNLNPDKRPSMEQVLEELKEELKIEIKLNKFDFF